MLGMKSPTTLQTVDRALSFLEHVAAAPSAPTVQQVSVALKLNITTCYHLMRTLISRGYLERNPDATLTLGSQVGRLFDSYRKHFNLDQRLATIVEELARDTSETAFLSVLDKRKLVLKFLVEGSQPLRVGGLFVGLTGNEHSRASGKAVLAFLPDTERDVILERSLADLPTRERKKTLKLLLADLAEIRERGWSFDSGHTELGISGIGAPVFDSDGAAYGAVGVVTPTLRMEKSQSTYVERVIAAAQEATHLLRGQRAVEPGA